MARCEHRLRQRRALHWGELSTAEWPWEPRGPRSSWVTGLSTPLTSSSHPNHPQAGIPSAVPQSGSDGNKHLFISPALYTGIETAVFSSPVNMDFLQQPWNPWEVGQLLQELAASREWAPVSQSAKARSPEGRRGRGCCSRPLPPRHTPRLQGSGKTFPPIPDHLWPARLPLSALKMNNRKYQFLKNIICISSKPYILTV